MVSGSPVWYMMCVCVCLFSDFKRVMTFKLMTDNDDDDDDGSNLLSTYYLSLTVLCAWTVLEFLLITEQNPPSCN